MRRKLLVPLVLAPVALVGCANNHPVRRVEQPVNVTHEVAFGDYRRVYNTTYHILNRYGVIQNASYRYGEITALVGEDNHLFDKTRRTIQARIFDAGDFFDVECRVLIAVEDSEVATFPDQFQPRYSWKTVASDQFLETRLNNEIRAALSGGAWQAKEPLRPQPRQPATSEPRPAREQRAVAPGAAERTDEVRVRPAPGQRQVELDELGPAAFERLGVASLRQGDYRRAEAAFRATLEADGRDPFAHYLLAQALFSRGAFEEATTHVRAGAALNAAFARADLDLRDLYAEGDGTFAARLGEVEARARDQQGLWLLAGYLRMLSGDAQGAVVALDRAPQDGLARALRASALERVEAARGIEEF
ncbi:MAG: tetratricopeptide repeat protein [Planctomycetes bacterium]|nr:tetratricopeptide repeat protein [Planctomycetota bacterium]